MVVSGDYAERVYGGSWADRLSWRVPFHPARIGARLPSRTRGRHGPQRGRPSLDRRTGHRVTPHDGLAPVDGIASWTIADFGGQPVVAVGVHTGGLVLTMPTNGPDPGRASAPGSGGWT